MLSDFEKTGDEGLVSFMKRTMNIGNSKPLEHVQMDDLKANRDPLGTDGVDGPGTTAPEVDRQLSVSPWSGTAATSET